MDMAAWMDRIIRMSKPVLIEEKYLCTGGIKIPHCADPFDVIQNIVQLMAVDIRVSHECDLYPEMICKINKNHIIINPGYPGIEAIFAMFNMKHVKYHPPKTGSWWPTASMFGDCTVSIMDIEYEPQFASDLVASGKLSSINYNFDSEVQLENQKVVLFMKRYTEKIFQVPEDIRHLQITIYDDCQDILDAIKMHFRCLESLVIKKKNGNLTDFEVEGLYVNQIKITSNIDPNPFVKYETSPMILYTGTAAWYDYEVKQDILDANNVLVCANFHVDSQNGKSGKEALRDTLDRNRERWRHRGRSVKSARN